MKLFKKSFFISLFCFLPMVGVVSLFTEITLNVSTFLKHLFIFSGLFFGYFFTIFITEDYEKKIKKGWFVVLNVCGYLSNLLY